MSCCLNLVIPNLPAPCSWYDIYVYTVKFSNLNEKNLFYGYFG